MICEVYLKSSGRLFDQRNCNFLMSKLFGDRIFRRKNSFEMVTEIRVEIARLMLVLVFQLVRVP